MADFVMSARVSPFILIWLTAIGCGSAKQESIANADSIDIALGTTPDVKTYPIQINDSTQVLLLQWKEISLSEYGPSYSFEDKKGNIINFRLIEMPGFDFQKNEYFTASYDSNSVFPVVTLNPSVVNAWYQITVVEAYRDVDGAGGNFPIIKLIEIVK